ncbi:MAG: hypothetical protein QXZ69_00205 [Candidatus Micrarchaeia archaeon]
MALNLFNYLFYFVVGGLVVSIVVFLEESGYTLLSRIALLFPIITWVSYLFIGNFGTPQQVADSAKFVLFGTIVAWIPYMLSIIYLSPRLGVDHAILVALIVFIAIASIYSYVYYNVKI